MFSSLLGEGWLNLDDLVYAISRSFFYEELYDRTNEIRLESKRQRT